MLAFYRWSLRLLPRSLRGEHRDEMLAMVAARLSDRRALARTGIYVLELADLYRTLLRERMPRPRGAWRRSATADHGTGNDLQYALRTLRRRPGYAAVVVAILALGVAAVTAVFTVVNGVLLRPLPYADSDRIAIIWTELDRSTNPTSMTVSPADFLDWRLRARSFQQLEAHNLWHPILSGPEGDATTIQAGLVTPGVFDLLGIRPLLGRTFRPDESAGSPRVTVLSYGLWRARYGSDSGMVGKEVRLNGQRYEVIGVLPSSYRHPDPHRPLLETQLFVPFDMSAWPHSPHRFLRVLGRLAPGVSLEGAEAEMDTIARALERVRPETNTDTGTILYSLREQFYASIRPALILALLGAGLLFVIVFANVTNLVLTRSLDRKREFAVRAALGAGRIRLAKQMVVENGLLAVGGSVLGVLLVVTFVDLLRGLQGRYLPTIGDISLDVRVVAFAMVLATLITVLLGVLPAGEFSRTPLRTVLLEEGRGTDGSRRSQRIRAGLVVGEVSLAAALVVGAGLLSRSLHRLAAVDPGFAPGPVLTAELHAPRERYRSSTEAQALFEELSRRFSALPGVAGVGYASELPMVDGNWSRDYEVVEQPQDRPSWPTTEYRIVSPGYFAAMRIPLRSGRPFLAADADGAPPVVIVNEMFATTYWAPGAALGQRLRWEQGDTSVVGEIVGVVANVLDNGLAGLPEPFIYYPFAQSSQRSAAFAIRAAGDPSSIARAVREVIRGYDTEIPVNVLESYQVRIQGTIAQSRFASHLATGFSGLALLIAGLGIYGVMAYAVVARTREIGIRMALGARRQNVMMLFLRQGVALALAGVVVGLAVAVAAGRLLESLLFGVSVGDPLAYASAPLLLLVVAILASVLPTRRAIAVEPMRALRSDGY